MVGGHADTSGSYEYNLDLSEKRTETVANYCVEHQPMLSAPIVSKGYSFENPLIDEKGNIDTDTFGIIDANPAMMNRLYRTRK